MLRRWTNEETSALQNFVNTHTGHRGGLNSIYWNELSLVLEGVRHSADTTLQKHQVTNKIISFRKRQVSCRYILEHGTSEGQMTMVEKHKSRSSYVSPSTTTIVVEGTSPVSTRSSVGRRNHVRSDRTIEDKEEQHMLNMATVFLELPRSSPGLRDLRDIQDVASEICKSSEARSNSREGRKRTRTDKSTRDKRNGKKSRESRAKRKRLRYEEPVQENIEGAERIQPQSVNRETTDGDTGNVPWQDFMHNSWQNHLTFQSVLPLVSQSEPISHRDVSFAIEGITKHVSQASLWMEKMYPSQGSFTNIGESLDHISAVLTGCKTRHEAEDVMRISRSLPPLLRCANFIEALIGATLYLWVFKEFQSFTPSVGHHSSVRTILDEFIERGKIHSSVFCMTTHKNEADNT